MNVGVIVPSSPTPETPSPGELANICGTDKPARVGLAESSSPQIRKLAEYEKVCNGAFASKLMFFARMPADADEAPLLAADMARTLKEFAARSVSPLVVWEPTTEDGTILEIKEFQNGQYDAALETYFQSLKGEGITDEMMGMWVPFPEANSPMWHTTEAKDFVANVNLAVGLQKQYFPQSKASIMLNSQSYPNHDDAWQHGEYKSLVPFVKGIDKGLIDSFGYQGFPWLPPANEPDANDAITEPKEFLRADLAQEAAEALGITSIWLNTGTFAKSHAKDPETSITMKAHEREVIMKDILAEAKKLTDKDFTVALHLFAEDKTAVKEAVDWSYWPLGDPEGSDATPVFQEFVRTTLLSGMEMWLYDDDHIRL